MMTYLTGGPLLQDGLSPTVRLYSRMITSLKLILFIIEVLSSDEKLRGSRWMLIDRRDSSALETRRILFIRIKWSSSQPSKDRRRWRSLSWMDGITILEVHELDRCLVVIVKVNIWHNILKQNWAVRYFCVLRNWSVEVISSQKSRCRTPKEIVMLWMGKTQVAHKEKWLFSFKNKPWKTYLQE